MKNQLNGWFFYVNWRQLIMIIGSIIAKTGLLNHIKQQLMNRFKTLSVTLILIVFISQKGISQNRLYENPKFPGIARTHEVIAVLPFNATINLRPKQMAEISTEQLNKLSQDGGYGIQQSMYSWFLARKQRGGLIVDVQSPVETNAIMQRNNIDYLNMSSYTPQELAKILNVDAVIMGQFQSSKPMSEGASVALGLLVGFWGTTDKAVLNMFIYNGVDGETLFNYNRAISGSLGTNTDNLINRLMRKASRKVAYTK